jgi:drug/metabolite transporter (DMT)-like permease
MTRRALILFGVMSLIWGIPYLFIRVAVAEMSPATLVFGRTAIAALVLVPIALLRSDFRPVLARWRWVVAFAVAEVGIPWVLLGSAEQHITSSLAGLLVAGVPLVGTVLAVATRGRDRIHRRGIVGLLVGLAGVAAIVGSNLGVSDPTALFEMIFVVVGYAVGPAILARRLAGLPSVGVMAMAVTLCALVYAPVAFVQRPTAVPSPAALFAVLVLGLVCTAAAFVLFNVLIGEIGPVRSTVITYVNPAVASVLGVLVLNETLTVAMVAGLVLVILGSTLATGGAATTPEPVPEPAPEPAPERAPEPAPGLGREPAPLP